MVAQANFNVTGIKAVKDNSHEPQTDHINLRVEVRNTMQDKVFQGIVNQLFTYCTAIKVVFDPFGAKIISLNRIVLDDYHPMVYRDVN